jgi:site-specific DNA-methyltransferase (adenine-specific)
MTPYFDNGQGIVIYHGDSREILPTLDPSSVGLLLSDPPYGVKERTARYTAGRSGREGSGYRGSKPEAVDFPPVHGDDRPFDPSHLLRFPRLILFGANHYANRLPQSSSWLIWDKLDGLTSRRPIGFNDNGDAELAWTNLGGPVRLIPCRWMGILKKSELGRQRVHPTQKPVALMRWLIEMYSKPGDLILDPYMGSGPTVEAARDTRRRCIGIEIEEAYCRIAELRLEQVSMFEVTA